MQFIPQDYVNFLEVKKQNSSISYDALVAKGKSS